jgi:L-alanine-DL-glutamate epimerase-like enolase superfamily enzyme
MDRVGFGCSPANQGIVLDVSETPIGLDAGVFAVPAGPGLGVEIDEGMLASLAG